MAKFNLPSRSFGANCRNIWTELYTTVNERRHGSTMYMPIAISFHDLREIVSERLGEGKPVPSEDWLRLPRNPYASNALRYTGRFQVKTYKHVAMVQHFIKVCLCFQVKYAVQARQMRKSHPDNRYVAVILQCMKRFAISIKEYALLLSVD